MFSVWVQNIIMCLSGELLQNAGIFVYASTPSVTHVGYQDRQFNEARPSQGGLHLYILIKWVQCETMVCGTLPDWQW